MKFIISLLIVITGCRAPASAPEQKVMITADTSSDKINGISITASRKVLQEDLLDTICAVSANYICLLPFAFVPDNSARVIFNSGFQDWGESPQGVADCIRMAHQYKLKVMVKPQLWIHQGKFTGELMFKNESEWNAFEQDYTNYIFSFLNVAQEMQAEIFCVGTELESFVKHRPQYWTWLIDTARKSFDGKLTYAENWDCYNQFPLWEKLDYIGVSSYFPLSITLTASVEELKRAWVQYVSELRRLADQKKKLVLFTEYGYRSIDACTSQPWDAYSESPPNNLAQENAYTALYETFWDKSWFSGGFSWKWFDANTHHDVPVETDYTPQGKPALKVLEQWYSR
ncbi:MAG: hypothetical protein ABIQ74_05730 [Chitinophagales bacterium]